MKKLKLALILLAFLGVVGQVLADTVTIDVTGWTQEKKNMVTAMSVGILYSNGTTYSKISHDGKGNITVDNPVGSLSYLTAENITSRYNAWKVIADAEMAKAIAEEEARQAELSINDLSNVTMAQIDNRIDTIIDSATNVATLKTQVKILLKKIVKYMKAKGL